MTEIIKKFVRGKLTALLNSKWLSPPKHDKYEFTFTDKNGVNWYVMKLSSITISDDIAIEANKVANDFGFSPEELRQEMNKISAACFDRTAKNEVSFQKINGIAQNIIQKSAALLKIGQLKNLAVCYYRQERDLHIQEFSDKINSENAAYWKKYDLECFFLADFINMSKILPYISNVSEEDIRGEMRTQSEYQEVMSQLKS